MGAHDLEDHLTGLSPCPSSVIFVNNDDENCKMKQPNPHYHMCKKCDKLLMSWLLASISELVCDHVAKCVTTSDVWKALESYFVTETKVRVVHLKNTLQTMKKGALSISHYIKKMKEIADAINTNGQSISEGELIAFVVDGLCAEYDSVIVHVHSKLDSPDDNITLAEVKFILQKFEQRINKNNLLNLDVYGSTVNYASQTRVNNTEVWRNHYDKNVEKSRAYNQTSTNQTTTSADNNERARGRLNQKMKVIC